MSTRRLPELLIALALGAGASSAPVAAAEPARVAASAPSAASSTPAASASQERARIAREMADVNARARSAEAACAQQFAVSSCLAQVRSERRLALRQLERQRAVLDDAQRREKAAQRVDRVRQRQEQSAKDDARPRVEVRTRGADPKPGGAPVPAAPERPESDTERATKAAAAASAAQAQAARRVEAAARRASEAQAHRDAVEQRQRERAASGRVAAPLPVPASAPR